MKLPIMLPIFLTALPRLNSGSYFHRWETLRYLLWTSSGKQWEELRFYSIFECDRHQRTGRETQWHEMDGRSFADVTGKPMNHQRMEFKSPPPPPTSLPADLTMELWMEPLCPSNGGVDEGVLDEDVSKAGESQGINDDDCSKSIDEDVEEGEIIGEENEIGKPTTVLAASSSMEDGTQATAPVIISGNIEVSDDVVPRVVQRPQCTSRINTSGIEPSMLDVVIAPGENVVIPIAGLDPPNIVGVIFDEQQPTPSNMGLQHLNNLPIPPFLYTSWILKMMMFVNMGYGTWKNISGMRKELSKLEIPITDILSKS
ncbi:hypothetical protein L2E82_28620 [Cichorium intybus]|uniref:Uncharacterized protein n=1 Tax=Cichorium intybus TaxID=13427 RepID=A0ACB9CWM8_CICIN|nr:hypothetical protein L2E82_28620 [Cichorium intybus]